MKEALLTSREVAARLNTSNKWVLEHAAGRRLPIIPSMKLGKLRRFRESDIDDFLRRASQAMEEGVPIQ